MSLLSCLAALLMFSCSAAPAPLDEASLASAREQMVRSQIEARDVRDPATLAALRKVPRHLFVPPDLVSEAYADHPLPIGRHQTISQPYIVAFMTEALGLEGDDTVLEVGTGSGYQSAYLSNLTDKVWTIEIIKPLFERTGGIYADLIAHGYSEYKAITRKNADGYYGWPQAAPFDKIIVTCGIDHVPPPLLQQLKPNGIMVIPVGPPGAQHVLKIVKEKVNGSFRVARSDIYNGRIVPFVPFTKLVGGKIVGTHNGG